MRDHPGKECDRGVKLQIVGMAKDVVDGADIHSVDQGGAVAKAVAQDGVNEVRIGLGGFGNSKPPRHRT